MFQIGDEVLYLVDGLPSNLYKGIVISTKNETLCITFFATKECLDYEEGYPFGTSWYPKDHVIKGKYKEKTIEEKVLDKIASLEARFKAKQLPKSKRYSLSLP